MAEIIKEIRSMREGFVIANEILDKIEENGDTDEYVDPDMFCASGIHERYGSGRPALILTVRAERSTVRQEEGESMATFGDWVYSLTNHVYPDFVNDPTILQSLALPGFLKEHNDRNAAQEAMKFGDPKSIQEAVVTITHIQGAPRIFALLREPSPR